VELDVREAPIAFDREQVLRVSGEWRSRKYPGPGAVFRLGRLDRARLGEVPPEKRRVHVDAADHPGQAEPHDAPVVTRLAAAARFPPVHPLAAIGVLVLAEHGLRDLDEVLLRREELVIRRDRGAAQALRRQVHEIGEVHS
jgi:hypothetical protein